MFPEKDKKTSPRDYYQIKRSGNYALHSFDFERLIFEMKHESRWKKGEMIVKVLIRNPIKKIMLVLLHGNSEITSHQVNDSTDFNILEGKVELHFLKESFTLVNGELLKLIEKTSFRINAIEETAFLIIMKSQSQCN
jgi:hypothetical protein